MIRFLRSRVVLAPLALPLLLLALTSCTGPISQHVHAVPADDYNFAEGGH